AIQHVPRAVMEGKWDFCDKVFQQTSSPRVLLIGFTTILALFWSLLDISLSIKWWVLLLVLIVALLLAVPRKLYQKRLFYALLQLPYFFLLMVLNLSRIKGANKKFIHTRHGIK
ncbi:MAG: glycosyltransferase family 2 protein, partial [Bacteroidales bacterium]